MINPPKIRIGMTISGSKVIPVAVFLHRTPNISPKKYPYSPIITKIATTYLN